MDILSSLENVVSYIEENLCEEIDIDGIAKTTTLNEYELSNLFRSLTGMTMKEYIRKRRLTCAAIDLQSGNEKVIDVAMKYGYESCDSFRRAFVSQHNVSPSSVKSRSAALNIYPPLSFEIKVKGNEKMNFKIVENDGFDVYGIVTPCFSNGSNRYDFARELWSEDRHNISQKICSGYDGIWYAIWSNSSYTIARDKSNCNENSLEKAVIPKGKYAVFTTEKGGYAGDEFPKLHNHIFDCWLPNSDYELASDFELEVYHLATDRQKRRKERYYEIWIPVKAKKNSVIVDRVKIRKAQLTDAFALAEISKNDLGYECDEALVSERLKQLDSKREQVFVADIDGIVTGFIHIELYNVIYCEKGSNLLGLAVSPDYRNNGIGRALLKRAEEWAKNNGAKWVRLNSGESRKDAHRFYRNLGYDNEKKHIRFIKQL